MESSLNDLEKICANVVSLTSAAVLLDEITEVIKERRRLGRHMLLPLLTPMTRTLYLGYGVTDIHYVVRDIAFRAQVRWGT